VSLAKTAEPIEMPFGLRTRVRPRDHVFVRGPDPPSEGAIFREKDMSGLPDDTYAVSCSKMAEPIKMLFGLWTLVGPMKHECTLAPPGEYD